MKQFWRSYFLTSRFYALATLVIFLYIGAAFFPWMRYLAEVLFYLGLLSTVLDTVILFINKTGVVGDRTCAEKFSNGDDNPIKLTLENRYNLPVQVTVLEELPDQFQIRDQQFDLKLKAGEVQTIDYQLRPVKRGEYLFGVVNLLIASPIGLVLRKVKGSSERAVAVYPSFIQMRKYELLALSNQLKEFGIKKIRRIGNNMEFEQIKNYVSGDDYRKVNWKASARRGDLMVNQFQDERSQQVYSVIDKGRAMRMPFDGLTLLDYAINASLVISNIALKKGDKAGVITFQEKVNSVLPASSRNIQLNLILEHLYKQKTAYKESNLARLYGTLRRKLNQRSLILLYTNFESLSSLKRQLPSLRRIAKQHLLVCIFFENTEVGQLINTKAEEVEEIYTKGIAEQLVYEKKLIMKELNAHGIHTILTPPKELSVNTINKYLELKARGLI